MKKEKQLLSVSLDIETIKKIDAKAKANSRTRHYLMKQAIEKAFK